MSRMGRGASQQRLGGGGGEQDTAHMGRRGGAADIISRRQKHTNAPR